MHELSIAMSILEFAEEEAAKRGAAVEAVHVRIGAMSGVVKQALISAYDLARESTALEDCRLVIEDVPVVIYCRGCQAERAALSAQLPICPVCHAPSAEFISGKELEVVGLEVAA
jgi:hydrogenase nickel incorporation protein HypA/HybF